MVFSFRVGRHRGRDKSHKEQKALAYTVYQGFFGELLKGQTLSSHTSRTGGLPDGVVINTKHPEEQEASYIGQAKDCITTLQKLGVQVLYTGGHHRKLAIIDREVLYEGSLNILSQNDSCEIMRRICSEEIALQMLEFTKIGRFLERYPFAG